MSPVPPQERDRLITNCQGLVRSIAWKIHQRLPASVDLDDLVSCGQVGLAEAARDFDPDRGGQFTTFAWYRVRGSILDGLAKMRWFNRGDFEGGRYERMAHEALADGRASPGEAVESGDALAREGRWLKGVSSALAVTCMAALAADSEEGLDRTDGTAERPEAIVIRREVITRLRELVDGLPVDAQTLIRATYFEGVTLTEAAARVGISKAWASRLHSRTLSRLAAALQEAGLGD
jgi:RNA polymerase sigma factor for flagellar operon FliA